MDELKVWLPPFISLCTAILVGWLTWKTNHDIKRLESQLKTQEHVRGRLFDREFEMCQEMWKAFLDYRSAVVEWYMEYSAEVDRWDPKRFEEASASLVEVCGSTSRIINEARPFVPDDLRKVVDDRTKSMPVYLSLCKLDGPPSDDHESLQRRTTHIHELEEDTKIISAAIKEHMNRYRHGE